MVTLPSWNFKFWTNWLLIVNLITVLIGILIALFGNSLLFELHNEGTRNLFFAGEKIPEGMLNFKNWLFGIIGATISGFHILVVFIVHYAFRQREIWARNAITLGLTTWFIIDTGVSFYHGAYYNIYMVNIPSFFLLSLPLAITWKEFSIRKS